MIQLDTPHVAAVSSVPAIAVASEAGSWLDDLGSAAPPPPAPPSQSNWDNGITLPTHESEWSERLQSRFNALVRLKALRRISSDEIQELSALQIQRRELLTPPTVDEVLNERMQQQIEDKLIAALRAYVRIKPSNR